MIEKNIESYVKVYPNWLDAKECKQTINELSQHDEWSQHTFYDAVTKKESKLSGDNELDVIYSNLVTTKKYVMQRIWDSIYDYIKELDSDHFRAWQGYTDVRFNRYEIHQTMSAHCDHIQTIFDGDRKGIPILSFVATLNDDYEGGEFVMWDDKVIEMKEGTAIIFPSCFLYPHMVRPVTKGVRYSCVSWVW
jgi:predicted 2-oxoglutarate/Fe(II)-dependent dioxygenase YbiX